MSLLLSLPVGKKLFQNRLQQHYTLTLCGNFAKMLKIEPSCDQNGKITTTKRRSRTTAQQYGGEHTFSEKETMYLLETPSVILPYF